MTRSIHYILKKLAGAGFFFVVLSSFLLLSSEIDDGFEFVEEISVVFWWIILFSLATSMIDFIVQKFLMNYQSIKLALYVVSGVLYFLLNPMEIWTFYFILGLIGAMAGLTVYMGMYLAKKSTILKIFLSIVVPLVCFIFLNLNFTDKQGWVEERTETSYEASFDYFNGRHEVPIKAEKGESITSSFEFNNINEGGWSFHILNELGQKVGRAEINDDQTRFEAKRSGVYRFVIIGDDVEGRFRIEWAIE
ncbi:hypothetical protein [Piscibacillus salipiscarius]|uniref:Uncharacterized protein n=1 Tax=Piscibacillus salipiscarius TaxID=299480 RepID=A0ABW5QBH7_9BACI|nr:hypothetical protein [Piscibacillus salipiscarius]